MPDESSYSEWLSPMWSGLDDRSDSAFVGSLNNHLSTFTAAELYVALPAERIGRIPRQRPGLRESPGDWPLSIRGTRQVRQGSPSLADEFIHVPSQTLEAIGQGHASGICAGDSLGTIDGTVREGRMEVEQELPAVETKDVLASLNLHVVCSADEEAVEFLLASAVAKIWKRAYRSPADEVRAERAGESVSWSRVRREGPRQVCSGISPGENFRSRLPRRRGGGGAGQGVLWRGVRGAGAVEVPRRISPGERPCHSARLRFSGQRQAGAAEPDAAALRRPRPGAEARRQLVGHRGRQDARRRPGLPRGRQQAHRRLLPEQRRRGLVARRSARSSPTASSPPRRSPPTGPRRTRNRTVTWSSTTRRSSSRIRPSASAPSSSARPSTSSSWTRSTTPSNGARTSPSAANWCKRSSATPGSATPPCTSWACRPRRSSTTCTKARAWSNS